MLWYVLRQGQHGIYKFKGKGDLKMQLGCMDRAIYLDRLDKADGFKL